MSHLGPAVATLARMKELEPARNVADDAEQLLSAPAGRSGRTNSAELWRDRIGVAAFVGRETAIAAMIDYGCAADRAGARTGAAPTTATSPRATSGDDYLARSRGGPAGPDRTGSWSRRSSSPGWISRTG